MVAVNLGIWVLLLLLSKRQDGGRYLDNWGVDAPDLAYNHEWWRIVTSGFMHVSLIHVGMNCAILWQLGQLTERAYGRTRFLLLYFAALCAGAFGAVLLSPNNLTVGASGAVFGLLGAALFELRGRGVSITRTPIFATLVINLVFTLAIPGISVGGHIGGLTGGLIVGWVYSQRQRADFSRHLQWLVPVAVIVISVAGALIAAQAAVN
jgi:membrane associated rhomboid family serine protease